MHLKPPIPRMNSPNISHPKAAQTVRSFLLPAHKIHENRRKIFMLQSLSQNMKPDWRRALAAAGEGPEVRYGER